MLFLARKTLIASPACAGMIAEPRAGEERRGDEALVDARTLGKRARSALAHPWARAISIPAHRNRAAANAPQ